VTPEQALLRVVHCLDRVHDTGFRTKAFVRALDVVRSTPPDELAQRAACPGRALSS
jgi:putative hydrolase